MAKVANYNLQQLGSPLIVCGLTTAISLWARNLKYYLSDQL